MIPRLDYQDSLSPTTLQFLELLARSAFRGDIEKSYASRLAMATDNSVYQVVPQAVLYPRSADDIAVMLKLAQGPEYATLSFFPRGGGTGTNGQSLGGGIIVDLSRHMNQIMEINLEEGWVRAQAGVVKDQLNAYLKPHGYFFSPDLSTSNRATLGGMVNTDASGQGSLVYGKTSDHVLGLKAVLENGGAALDAVTAAVCALEDDPLFNAGRGAVYTRDGTQEMDAAIMDGRDRRAGAVAALVVWVFLRSVRSTLIISLAIPVSLAGAIAVIYFAGFTLNSLTMLGLLLLIGVVVDDAIVVLENIFRHRETIDPDPVSAAINGSNEVVFAVMAATLSLVCIFAPVAFISGIIGQFFRSFALVVTFGVLVSLFVSLTLTPMLCSRYLKVEKQHGPIYRAFDRFFAGLDALYVRLLDGALSHRLWVVLATVAVVASSGFFFANVGKAFAPDADEGRFLVSLRTPLGSSIDYTDAKLREVEAILDTHPEIRSEFSLIGLGAAGQVNQGTVVVRMVPRGERTLKQQDVIPMLRQEFTRIAGARVFAAPYPMVQGARGEPLQFVLTGTNLQELGQHAQALQRKLAALPALGRIDTDLQLDLPQLIFSPDRLRIADAGLATQDVALAINMLTGGVDIAKFNDEPGDGQRYDIRVKAREGTFTQPATVDGGKHLADNLVGGGLLGVEGKHRAFSEWGRNGPIMAGAGAWRTRRDMRATGCAGYCAQRASSSKAVPASNAAISWLKRWRRCGWFSSERSSEPNSAHTDTHG